MNFKFGRAKAILLDEKKEDPQKVDWTIEDQVKCEDCIYSAPRSNYNDALVCWASQHKGEHINNTHLLRRHGSLNFTLGFDACGVEGKYFERKVPEVYDFRNNPPVPMQWLDEELYEN